MTDKNRNLALRVASAAVTLPLVLWLLWRGGAATAGLMAVVAGLSALEFYGICLTRGGDRIRYLGALAAAALPVLALHPPARFAQIFPLAASGLLIALFAYYLIAGPLEQAANKAALTFFGVAYCGLGIGALAALRDRPQGLEWVFLALLLTFGNDTGAYFAGRFFGRHKLYQRVSPNKTWEGFVGGMAATVALAFVARASFLPDLGPLECLALGLPCSVLGPAGDLCESMLKRAYGIKDSGAILPGHGGLLDRVDALLFNSPYLLLYALLSR